jgi:competence ComEA-like helix-hairpin-helix protein
MRQTSQQSIQSFAFVISIGAAVCLACGFISDAGSDATPDPPRYARLDSRINPNDATVESLIRLPGLGLGRAGAIVAYREGVYKEGRYPAFEKSEDLRKVRGIGPKTVQGISEWITFEQNGNSRDG